MQGHLYQYISHMHHRYFNNIFNCRFLCHLAGNMLRNTLNFHFLLHFELLYAFKCYVDRTTNKQNWPVINSALIWSVSSMFFSFNKDKTPWGRSAGELIFKVIKNKKNSLNILLASSDREGSTRDSSFRIFKFFTGEKFFGQAWDFRNSKKAIVTAKTGETYKKRTIFHMLHVKYEIWNKKIVRDLGNETKN